MKVLTLLRMGDRNCYYHLEGILRSRNIDELILLREKEVERLNNRKIRQIIYKRPKYKLLLIIKLYIQLVRYIKDFNIDYIMSFYAFPYGFIARLVSLRTGIPCHIGFVGSDGYKHVPHPLLRPINKLLSFSHSITVTGKDMKDVMIKYGYKNSNFFILPNAVPVEKIKINNINSIQYDLLFIGALITRKDIVTIIKTAGEVTRVLDTEIKICIIGEGPEKGKLLKIAKQQPAKCKIDFVGYQKNTYQFLSKSYIFLMASKIEGLPFALIEAMCAGLVPVTTPVASIKEIINHRYNGFLYGIEDYKTAAEYIIELIKDKNKYLEIRQNALKIRKSFSFKNAGKVWDSILKNN